MGFEDRILHNIDRNRERAYRTHTELPPLIEKAYERAHEMFNNPAYAIQAPEFLLQEEDGEQKGVYSKEQIIADMLEVKRLEKIFDRDNTPEQKNTKKYADILEALILEQAEMSDWLGENVTTLKTSRYDDYKNKTDMLAEWSSPDGSERILGLAVDITFSSMATENKLAQIKREVEKDKLGSIRYFRNASGTFMGLRENVPRVVIGVEKKTITELAGLWVRGDKQGLASHPVQHVLVDEIKQQTKHLLEYAENSGSEKAARAYRQILAVVGDIEESRKDAQRDNLDSDHVYRSIKRESSGAL